MFLCQCKRLFSHIAIKISEPVWAEAFCGRGGFSWVTSPGQPHQHQGRDGTGAGVGAQRQASLALSVTGPLKSHLKWL